jgi:hypothetical protein
VNGRIRWDGADDGEATGYVGSLGWPVFRIWPPDDKGDCLLFVYLAGHQLDLWHGATVDGQKAAAERLLEEFVSSLGAVFPAEAFEFPGDDELPEVKFAAGTRVRFAHPDAGYPGEADDAMKALVPGMVYTVAWADIGQSRTDLNLAVRGRALGRFNSVLFEPVDDEETRS